MGMRILGLGLGNYFMSLLKDVKWRNGDVIIYAKFLKTRQ